MSDTSSSIQTTRSVERRHLPNEIILLILGYAFASDHINEPVDCGHSAHISRHQHSFPDWLFGPSTVGSLDRFLRISKTTTPLVLEAFYRAPHFQLQLGRPLPPPYTRHLLRRLNFSLAVNNGWYKNQLGKPTKPLKGGLVPRLPFWREPKTVPELINNVYGWKTLKFLTKKEMGFCNLKDLRVTLILDLYTWPRHYQPQFISFIA